MMETMNPPIADGQPVLSKQPTPEGGSLGSLSLYTIQTELSELLNEREEAEEAGDPDAVEAIDVQLGLYFKAEIKKIDGVVHAIRTYQDAAAQAKAEADRLAQRAKRFQDRADQIKARALQAMQDHRVKRLETPTNTLRVQGNGGLQPLDVLEVVFLPQELTFVQVDKMPFAVWKLIRQLICDNSTESSLAAVALEHCEVIPDTDAIRAALKGTMPCPECVVNSVAWPTCPRCEGKGVVPKQIPGVRLLPRGEHLRIE